MDNFNELNWLLSPELVENEFFHNIYEEKPLFIQRDNPNYYHEKLKELHLQNLLELAASLSILIKLVKAGEVAPARFPLEMDELLTYLQDGYTIVLYSMEKYNPDIQNLSKTLSAKFRCPVKANMYITPPKSQGLTPHYDDHDVMILQLSGKKQWEIFSREVEKPVIFQLKGGLKPKDKPRLLEISAGDLFYLPRGYVHKASTTTDEFSVHLTLGINVNTWYAFFDEMLKQITLDEVILRDAIHAITLELNNHQKIKQLTDLVCEKLNNPDLQQKVFEDYIKSELVS